MTGTFIPIHSCQAGIIACAEAYAMCGRGTSKGIALHFNGSKKSCSQFHGLIFRILSYFGIGANLLQVGERDEKHHFLRNPELFKSEYRIQQKSESARNLNEMLPLFFEGLFFIIFSQKYKHFHRSTEKKRTDKFNHYFFSQKTK